MILKINNINVESYMHIQNINLVLIHLHGINDSFEKIDENVSDYFYNRVKYFNNNIKHYGLEFRKNIHKINDFIEDLDTIIKYSKNIDNKPIFILAESMGANIAIRYIINNNYNYNYISGIIMLAPMLGIKDNMKPNIIVKSLLEPISYCLPNVSIRHKILETSMNEKYLEKKRKSTNYNNGYIKLGIGRECLNACSEIDKLLMLNIPFFIIHGDKDPITDCNISREFFIKSHCNNKDLLVIDTNRHGLLVENYEEDSIPKEILQKINDKINIWSTCKN